MASIKSFPNNQDTFIGAEDVMKWLHGRTSGVFGAGDNAAVAALPTPGMGVTISDGSGWMSNANADGIVWWNDNEATKSAKLQLAIDAADGTLDRIDRVIVEWPTTNYVDRPEIKILKGIAKSNPSAPALTNNSSIRQISLARISVPAGSTKITAGMITDERLNPAVCGIVTESVKIDTGTMQKQFESLLKSIQQELAALEAGTAVELKKLQFVNTVVPISAFVSNLTYPDFPYRAAVPLSGVISSMVPQVTFSVQDAVSGDFAPVAETYDGGIYIYVGAPPRTNVTIPTIIAWRGNA